MSSATTNAPRAAFGVGALISESLSLFFSNIVKICMIAFVPSVVGLVITGLIVGFGVALGTEVQDFSRSGAILGFVMTMLITMLIYGVVLGMMVLFAYDAKMGRVGALTSYFSPALRHAVPIAVLAIVVGILFGLGMMLFIIPGLWIYAVCSACIPAVIIEKAGFGALGRSAQLTKGYRWPIVGAIIVFGIIIVLLSMVAGFGGGLIGSMIGGPVGIVLNLLVTALITAFTYGLSAIFIALVYARLREIKEGVSVSDLAKVFE
ncbi:MAG: hypothetical protein AAF754_14715 [Pseudomonadota bacterium]